MCRSAWCLDPAPGRIAVVGTGALGTSWRFRDWRATLLLAGMQALLFGLVGVGLALPFGEPAPTWTFIVPAAVGAAWAIPMGVRVGDDVVVVRNQLRRHEVALDKVERVEFTDWVSGWGRRVLLRTSSRRAIRIAALAADNGAGAEALDLMIREQQSKQRRPR